MRSKPTREIRDRQLKAVLVRLDEHTRLLQRRLGDYWGTEARIDRTLSLIEAELAARLVHAAVYELNLRLLPHAVTHDPDADLTRRTQGLERARADHETRFGVVPQA